MKKKDLGRGLVVLLRNGDYCIVRERKTINQCEYCLLGLDYADNYALMEYYNDDLTHMNNMKEFDIMKVYSSFRLDNLVWERKPEILDEGEKQYLGSVIYPFRKKVISITKTNFGSFEFIQIEIKGLLNYEYVDLPVFIKDSMYKGMEINKEYSLKDLGL